MVSKAHTPSNRITSIPDIDVALLADTQAYLRNELAARPSERQLVKAWVRFYELMSPRIRRYAVASRVAQADLDDCVQQVWTELLRKLPSFRFDPARGRFSSWLFALVHSRAVDLLRKRSRQPSTGAWEQLANRPAGRECDPVMLCERQADRALVRQILGELQKRASVCSYRVLYLRWMRGHSVNEVAGALGLTTQQVRFRCHRMLQKLRLLFAGEIAEQDLQFS